MVYQTQLTRSSLSLIVFILLVVDQIHLKSAAQEYENRAHETEFSSLHNHHPLHPYWKFTYHRVYQPMTITRGNGNGNGSSTSVATRTRRKNAIAAMSIAAMEPHPLLKNKGATTSPSPQGITHSSIQLSEDSNLKWSSILEKELMGSLERQKMHNTMGDFHWRPWIQHTIEHQHLNSDIPILNTNHRDAHRRRHWKQHNQAHHHRHRDYR